MCFCVQHSLPVIYYSAEKSFLVPQDWQSHLGLSQLQNFAPSLALPASPFSPCVCCPCCCFCDCPCYYSLSRSQGRGSNVIHCRKDGTWSGSFHLCREMQGQCALPTQLNSHLKLQCSGGYGIGLWAWGGEEEDEREGGRSLKSLRSLYAMEPFT